MNGFVYCSVNKNISEYVQQYEYIHPVLGSDGTQVLLVVPMYKHKKQQSFLCQVPKSHKKDERQKRK